MTSQAYGNLLLQALAGNILIPGHPLKMGLLTASYVPNLTANIHWTDISGDETSGSGYTSGGATLSGVTLTLYAAASWSEAWAGANNYLQGDVVRPIAANGYVYMAAAGGTSGGSQPTWPTTAGIDVADSGVTWVCLGPWITVLTSDAPEWAGATFSTAWAVIYDSTSGVLVCSLDLGGTQSPSAQTFEVEPDPISGWCVFPPL